MADGDHLPSNEELFEHPVYESQHEQTGMNQQTVQQSDNQHNYMLVEQIQENANQADQQDLHEILDEVLGVPEDPQASGVVPMEFGGDNHPEPHQMMEPHEHFYPEDEQHQIQQPPADRVFQPTALVQPVYAPSQPRANNVREADLGNGDQNQDDNDEESEDDEENMARFDANEHTVWIDSDGDEETENIILKQNFFLPYSDHNYDCPDPSERVTHPEEGPFAIIEGLDEEGNVIRQYMPEGYEGHGEEIGQPDELDFATRETRQGQIQQHQPHLVQQQYQSQHHLAPPSLVPQLPVRRPVNAVPPYAGNHMEYEPARVTMPQRGIVPVREQQFRGQMEYGTPMMAAQPRVVQPNNRSVPTAVVFRGPRGPQGQETIYHSSPRANQPPAQRVAALAPQPGSYQHILTPTPGVGVGILRRSNPQQPPQLQGQRAVPVGPGIVAGQQRPVQRTNPQPRGIVDMQEREFVEHPLPLSHPPRRTQDVAPHRMTQEQRQEMQQQNRPRAQFPAQLGQRAAIGVRPTGMSAPAGTIISAQGTVVGRRMAGVPGAPSQEDLARSPQRAPQQARFQVKVTDTYSTPVPKPSDQLPTQLTEDPDEPSTSTASAPLPVPKEQEAPRDIPEEVKPPVTMKSPVRLASATSSPVKPQQHQPSGLQKPTPPHRMTQEEKSAHFAKLEKPAPSAQPGPSSSTPSSSSSMHQHHHLPPHLQLRADDTLSVVQSVFENPKQREPDTPKDKEEISKIANELKFSADKFSGNQQRQRTISGRSQFHPMQHQQQMQHLQNQHQNPMDMMHDGRKRHPSIGRYDMNLAGQMPQRPIPPHLRNQEPDPEPRIRHPEAGLEPPHRPRGRPRGSTGPQRARWPDGQEPVAPQRGGARTLPPRLQPAQPARNGAPVQNNSDSESEGIEAEGEESWEMRCHCGMDHGDGETVECEGCKTWQHMGCMGLTVKSDVSQYKCEKCLPRKLPVTKAEARKIQHKVLERLIKAGEKEDRKKEKNRKSEPVEPVKKQNQQPSSSRKSAPIPIQVTQPEIRVPQLNEYSKQAAVLLSGMQQTAGADTLLEDSRRHKKARRMFVEENVEALVTTEVVAIRQVILEMNGYVSMSSEVKRQPGGGNSIFMYDGLMKGTSGEEMGDGQELVCVDAKKKGNDSRFTRRSCLPNCVLKHVLGSQATLGIMIVATKDIHRNIEVTLPFDADWRDSDVPLECAEHLKELQVCPFEAERRRYANERHRSQETERRKAEEARRADEERRRLEDEVRLERAARTRQMDEEAELERMAQERAKKAERDEARKKKEAEKAEKKLEAERKEAEENAKREAEEKILAEKKAEEKRKVTELEKQKEAEKKKKLEEDKKRKQEEKEKKTSAEKSKVEAQPTKPSAREERKIQQIEEQFRHQEEREKRAKSQTPVRDEPSTSGIAPVRASARQRNRRESQSSEASSINTPGTTGRPKRLQSVASDFVTPAAKRVRATTVVNLTPQDSASRKRGAAANTSSSKTSEAKRAKQENSEHPPLAEYHDAVKKLEACGLKVASKKHSDYIPPDYDEPLSDWVSKLKDTGMREKVEKEKKDKDAESRKRKLAEADEKIAKFKAEAAEDEKRQKQAKKTEKVSKKEQEKEKSPETSTAPIVSKTPKSGTSKEQAKKETASAQIPEKLKTPKPSAPAPKDQASTSRTQKTAASQSSKALVAKESASTSSTSSTAPEKPSPRDDFHGMEREASMSTEGSVEKDLGPAAGTPTTSEKKNPKKLSMAEYNARKKQETSTPSSTSGASSSTTPARRGFIPSTEGSELVNVQLSAIPLDDHLSNKSTTTTAPSTGTSGTPADTVTSPSRSTRSRGAPSDSSADEPAHNLDLYSRCAGLFGLDPRAGGQPQQAAQPPAPVVEQLAPRIRNRPSRWNE